MLSRAPHHPLYDPFVRAFLIAICLLGCKKHETPDPAPEPPAEPSRGHSITHFKDASDGSDESGSAAAALDDAAPTADARLFGGDGSPAYRDADGRVHGPGGPQFMGKGLPCDASRDHCMREGVWFAADNMRPGAMFRALPSFKFEDKWYDWRGNEVEPGKLFKTELAKLDTIQVGAPIVFLVPENGEGSPWLDNEHDSLTSSRWDVAYVDGVNRSAKTFRVKGWPDDMSIDAARVITEQSSH